MATKSTVEGGPVDGVRIVGGHIDAGEGEVIGQGCRGVFLNGGGLFQVHFADRAVVACRIEVCWFGRVDGHGADGAGVWFKGCQDRVWVVFFGVLLVFVKDEDGLLLGCV